MGGRMTLANLQSADEAPDPRLRPFFSYYGSKAASAALYPRPQHRVIVEPFAGSAGYSLRYSAHQVVLCDADPVLVAVWRFLIAARPSEILSLPDVVEHVADLRGVAPEARLLVGYWLGRGLQQPRITAGSWVRRYARQPGYGSSFWGAAVKRRIAEQIPLIRHWQVLEGGYEQTAALGSATYFVDAPYYGKGGRRYRCGSTALDFERLGSWCRRLEGQVIVCEQAGASWLPFRELASRPGMRGRTREVMWTAGPVETEQLVLGVCA